MKKIYNKEHILKAQLNNFTKLFSKSQKFVLSRDVNNAYNHPAMLQDSRTKLYILQCGINLCKSLQEDLYMKHKSLFNVSSTLCNFLAKLFS